MLSQPISAPPTPVTPTHLFNPHTMDRSRSSEAALGRGGRGRDPKATSLLFDGLQAEEIVPAPDTAIEAVDDNESEGEPMEVDGPEYSADIVVETGGDGEEGPQIWGMPKWGWEEERKEVRPGVRLVGMEEVSTRSRTGGIRLMMASSLSWSSSTRCWTRRATSCSLGCMASAMTDRKAEIWRVSSGMSL